VHRAFDGTKAEVSMSQQHVHQYVKSVHQVRPLDGPAEDIVQWNCACGAVKGPELDNSGPKPGEWI